MSSKVTQKKVNFFKKLGTWLIGIGIVLLIFVFMSIPLDYIHDAVPAWFSPGFRILFGLLALPAIYLGMASRYKGKRLSRRLPKK